MSCIRVVELFSGIGAQVSALERLKIDHERVAVAEISETAYKAYCAIHGETPNLGDVTKIEHLPECDLLTYSSPCQDISIAGHKAGLKAGSGTRSATLWDVGRLLEDMRERDALPEVLLMENVNSILFKHAIGDFNQWISLLENLGYTNSYAVLNAKDYGIPQNRKRMFLVSTLTLGKFIFPKPEPLMLCLNDFLESDVPKIYYLSVEKIANYKKLEMKNQKRIGIIKAGELNYPKWIEMQNRVYSPKGLSPTLSTMQGGGQVPKIEIDDGIRYYTERECFRLMGQPEDAIEILKTIGIAKSKLYQLAGNSIVVDVLVAIFKGIYIEKSFDGGIKNEITTR